MLSLQAVICGLDTKILLHSLLGFCLCPASMIPDSPLPAMSSILDPQWIEGRYSSSQCSSSSSRLAAPVLPGSACSSRGLPCCWLCISFNPNPFHTSGKIPMKCQCFWSFWAGLQAPDPARLWERQTGLGPGLVSQLLLHRWS